MSQHQKTQYFKKQPKCPLTKNIIKSINVILKHHIMLVLYLMYNCVQYECSRTLFRYASHLMNFGTEMSHFKHYPPIQQMAFSKFSKFMYCK